MSHSQYLFESRASSVGVKVTGAPVETEYEKLR